MAADRIAAATGRAQTDPPGPGPGSGPGSGTGSGTGSGRAVRGGLSLPGILHFIQSEWARFEAEKGRWEAERAQMQAQVSFLQGERKGQENMKNDLMRRIRMLEVALKQERSKYHKLKFGTEPPPTERKVELLEMAANGPTELAAMEGTAAEWKEGRELLRQYLGDMFCSDPVLDVGSRRVRSLLVRGPPPSPKNPPGVGESLLVRRIEEQIQRNAGKEAKDPKPMSRPSEEEEDSDEEEDEAPPGEREPPRQHKQQRLKLPPVALLPDVEADGDDDDDDEDDDDDDEDEDDSEDALNEFDFVGSGHNRTQSGDGVCVAVGLPGLRDGDGSAAKGGREGSVCVPSDSLMMDGLGGAVSLGELAELTVSNDSQVPPCSPSPRRSWRPLLALRGHYDAVRGVAFHPSEAAVISASEDGTLKMWNLQGGGGSKRSAAMDVEPVYAFRGHRGPVLSVSVGRDPSMCCSGGADGSIHRWRLPDLNRDPYDGYDPGVLSGVLEGHDDAVWGLSFSPCGERLLSCSADGSVRLWDHRRDSNACLLCYRASGVSVPTSVSFCPPSPTHAVFGFRSGSALLYDLEAERPLLAMEQHCAAPPHLYQVLSHPSQPLSITASDDGGIRFLDHRTGAVVHSMVAHLDAVTCLAIDPNGVFLVSGSHDCSVRLWLLPHRKCIQELPAHRRKYDEAVQAVAFHPSRPLFASGGADSMVKVFV